MPTDALSITAEVKALTFSFSLFEDVISREAELDLTKIFKQRMISISY